MQAMMVQMQDNLQQQLQRQRQESEVGIESLLIGKGKTNEATPIPSTSTDKQPTVKQPTVTQFSLAQANELDKSQVENSTKDPLRTSPAIEGTLYRLSQSQYVRQPSFPSTYDENHAYHTSLSPSQNTSTKIKASDLPKFRGEKGDDVEV